MKNAGADTLIFYPTPAHGAIITKTIAKIGYQPKNKLTTFTLGDAIMFKIAGETWDGTYIGLPGNSGQVGSDPDADRVAAILKKYNPKIEGKEYLALFGAVSMMETEVRVKEIEDLVFPHPTTSEIIRDTALMIG